MNVERIANTNLHVHLDNEDCEVSYAHIKVMSERHANRVAAHLGWECYDQGPGGRFADVWYCNRTHTLNKRFGWDI